MLLHYHAETLWHSIAMIIRKLTALSSPICINIGHTTKCYIIIQKQVKLSDVIMKNELYVYNVSAAFEFVVA